MKLDLAGTEIDDGTSAKAIQDRIFDRSGWDMPAISECECQK